MTTNHAPTFTTRSVGRTWARPRLRPFRTPVRGYAFAAPPPGAPAPRPGAAASLQREPGNPADPLAVAVWVEDPSGTRWRIGYLDRGVAARLAPRLDGGVSLGGRLEGWVTEPDGRWRRPLLLVLPHEEAHAADGGTRTPPASPPDERPPAADPGAGARTASPRDERPPAATPGSSRPDSRLWGRPPGVSRRVVRPG